MKKLFLSAIVLGLLNFAIEQCGYGAFWVHGFTLLVVGIILSQLGIFLRTLSFKAYLYRVLLLCLASYVGSVLGSWGRRLGTLPLRRSCDQLSEVLERHRAVSGMYPDDLESVPELLGVAEKGNMMVRPGNFADRGGIYLDIHSDGFVDNPTLYLAPEYYLLLVPVERPLPFGFTRFDAYLKSSKDSQWRYENIGWHLCNVP